MGGNVSEWVFDWYKADYYSVADDTNPTGPSNRRSEGRVIRGGSFADPLEQARVANRRHQEGEYGYSTVGFRCARDKP
jgi:formylglycine-generating enzyme required for sulfatase activity